MRLQRRQFHPAGTWTRAHQRHRPRLRASSDVVRMRGGNLVRSLTPRQAVIWLMNLDEVSRRLPESVAPHFTREARARLRRALRARVATREGLTRRKS